MTDTSTNQQIAQLLDKQGYLDRVEMARYLHGAVADWIEEYGAPALDDDYFAMLLESWVQENLPATERGDVEGAFRDGYRFGRCINCWCPNYEDENWDEYAKILARRADQ